MSQPVLLQSSFKRGMVRDFPRDQMPTGTAWDLKDFIPSLDGEVLSKRGGWSYSSPSVSSISGGASGMRGVFAPTFGGLVATTQRLVGFTATGYSIDISSSSSAASVSSSDDLLVYPNPIMYSDQMIYMSVAGMRRWSGTGSTSSISTAPGGMLAVESYRSSLVAAEASGNKIYFAKPGDYGTWDSTNGFITTPGILLSLKSLASVMLVFTTTGVHRVRGAPPPYTGTTAQVSPDLTLDTIYNQGGLLTRSQLVVGELCYFATADGLFVTDGAGITDITEQSGFSRYWRDSFATINPRGAFDDIILGSFRQYILCSPLYGPTSGSPTDGGIGTLVYDTINKSWFRMTTPVISMYSTSKSTGETYFSLRNSPYVGKVSTMFSPTSSVKADADGTAIQPSLETPYYLFRPRGQKRLRNVYVGYDVRDAASDNPTLAVSYADGPEDTSYTSLGTLSETSQTTRQRIGMRVPAMDGVSFKIAQSNNSSETRIFDLEVDVHAREPSRR